jgi:hypothetical protein
MHRSIFICAMLAMLGGALLVGCGETSESTASKKAASKGALSKAEFIEKADMICQTADYSQGDEADAYLEKHEKELNRLAPIPAEEKMIVAVELPSILKEVEELETLEPPVKDKKEIESLMTRIREAVKKARKDPYAVEDEGSSENPFNGVYHQADRYGFEDCKAVI